MLFKAISEADPRETNWLHEPPAPKPAEDEETAPADPYQNLR